MAIVRAGLAVSDRLDKEIQEKNPLQIIIPGITPLTWKILITSREQTIHVNYKVNAEKTLADAKAFQSAYHFINNLYEQQNANLMKLKMESHQRQQAEKLSGSKESEKEKTGGGLSQPTSLAEAVVSFKISFTLPKAQPKIKAAGFMKPAAAPSLSISDTISSKQNSSSNIKEEEKPSGPGKKM